MRTPFIISSHQKWKNLFGLVVRLLDKFICICKPKWLLRAKRENILFKKARNRYYKELDIV
jgi:hypothetical protein